MRRASLAAVVGCAVLLLVGCNRHTPAGARADASETAQPAKVPDASRPPGKPAKPAAEDISIETFDCFKADGLEPDGGLPSGPAIGAWKSGGPGGAVWNATGLACVASVASTCRDGKIDSEVRIGRSLVARTTSALQNGKVTWRFDLRPPQWKKNLDDEAPAAKVPYRTAVFRLTSYLACQSPYQLQPSIGPRREFTAERSFVTGFAEGE
jgi:hypothetical protein